MTDDEQKRIFSNNFRYYVDASGKEQKQIAAELHCKYTTLNTWYRGTSIPNAAKIQTLADYFGILKSDLLDKHNQSNGNTIIDCSTDDTTLNLIQRFNSLDDAGKEIVNKLIDHELERMRLLHEKQQKIIHLAYYGKIAAAGTFIDSFELLMHGTVDVEDNAMSRCAGYAIGVSGDSMEPEYYDGDVVLVSKSRYIDYGDIGIFQYNNDVYIKKLSSDCLESLNPNYDPIPNNGDIRCLGKVLGKAELA